MLKKELTLTQIKSNLLIAKFMDLEKLNKHYYLYPQINDDDPLLIHYKQLKYHISWDWIMPVANEIIKSRDEQNTTWDLSILKKSLCTTNIDIVYTAVINFINWYNKQNFKTCLI